MSFDLEYAFSCIEPIISKLPITLYMTLASTVLALLLGIVFAVIIKKKIFILDKIVHLLNSILKGIPVLVMLYVLYYSMPNILTGLGISYDIKDPPKLVYGIFAFGISYVPYMCDMIVNAFDTIPVGQMEACQSIGFTEGQAMRKIIIPQMLVVSIPVFGNHFVNIVKMTSLAYMVSIIEMMGAAKNYATGAQKFMETYIVAALIYWIICIVFDKGFAFIERHSGKYRNKLA